MVPLPLLTIRHNIGIVNPFCLVFQPLLCPLHPKSLSPTSAGGMYVASVVVVGTEEITPPLFSTIMAWLSLIVEGYSDAVAAGVEAGSLTWNVIDNNPPAAFVVAPGRATTYLTRPSGWIMSALPMSPFAKSVPWRVAPV